MKLNAKYIAVAALTLTFNTWILAADKDKCISNVNAIHFANFVEQACKINGNVKVQLTDLFRREECQLIIPRDEFDNAGRSLFTNEGDLMRSMGGANYCEKSSLQYNGSYEVIKGLYEVQVDNSPLPQTAQILQSSPVAEVAPQLQAAPQTQVEAQASTQPQIDTTVEPIAASNTTTTVTYRVMQIVLVLSFLYFLVVGMFKPAYAFRKLTFIKNPTRLTAGGFAFVFFILIAIVQSVPAFKTIVDSDAKERMEADIKSKAVEAKEVIAKAESIEDASFKKNWIDVFLRRTWQDFEGVSCDVSKYSFDGNRMITTQNGKINSMDFTLDDIDESDKSFTITRSAYIKNGGFANFFPKYGNEISFKWTYKYKMLSDRKVKLMRNIVDLDVESMLKGNSLSYSAPIVDTMIISQCQ